MSQSENKLQYHKGWLFLLGIIFFILIIAFPNPKKNNSHQKHEENIKRKNVMQKGEVLKPEPSLRNSEYNPGFQDFKNKVESQAKRFPEFFFMQAKKKFPQPVIALTFDDGPDTTYTEPILDSLKKYNIPATFFLVGFKLERHPQVARRILKEGHEVGNHSYSHLNFTELFSKEEWFEGQIIRFQKLSQKFLNQKPTLVRPPYGQIRNEQIKFLSEKGYIIVNWSIDTYDWNEDKNSAIQIAERVLDYAHSGAIVLLHSGGQNRENTLAALPLIIQTLQSKGYKFVKVSDLIDKRAYF